MRIFLGSLCCVVLQRMTFPGAFLFLSAMVFLFPSLPMKLSVKETAFLFLAIVVL